CGHHRPTGPGGQFFPMQVQAGEFLQVRPRRFEQLAAAIGEEGLQPLKTVAVLNRRTFSPALTDLLESEEGLDHIHNSTLLSRHTKEERWQRNPRIRAPPCTTDLCLCFFRELNCAEVRGLTRAVDPNPRTWKRTRAPTRAPAYARFSFFPALSFSLFSIT